MDYFKKFQLIYPRLPDINDALAVGDNLSLVALVVGHELTNSSNLINITKYWYI